MIYPINIQAIPQSKRQEINSKILYVIDAKTNQLPKEAIFNCYTGIGGLHDLNFHDFDSFHDYTEAKKEIEMGQFYFRFIRLDSEDDTEVHFFNYVGTIEQNIMALVLTKERINEFIKSGEVMEQSAIFDEFGLSENMLDTILTQSKDDEGRKHINWGKQYVS